MKYSEDLRKKVVEFTLKGNSQRKTAETFGVNLTTVNKWVKIFRQTGEIKDKERKVKFRKIDPQKLLQLVEENPEAYLKEFAEIFNCSTVAIYKQLVKLGVTLKKKRLTTKNKTKKK